MNAELAKALSERALVVGAVSQFLAACTYNSTRGMSVEAHPQQLGCDDDNDMRSLSQSPAALTLTRALK